MAVCQPHNMRHAASVTRQFGIRVTLKGGTPFRRLLGADWAKFHWYGTNAERDAAYEDMTSQPGVYRIGDIADVVYEKVDAAVPGGPIAGSSWRASERPA